MQQVKIFKSVDTELNDLEVQINQWIANEKVRIISIQGNIAPQAGKHVMQGSFSQADVLVVVLFEKGA
jgi:hypothetical protein